MDWTLDGFQGPVSNILGKQQIIILLPVSVRKSCKFDGLYLLAYTETVEKRYNIYREVKDRRTV